MYTYFIWIVNRLFGKCSYGQLERCLICIHHFIGDIHHNFSLVSPTSLRLTVLLTLADLTSHNPRSIACFESAPRSGSHAWYEGSRRSQLEIAREPSAFMRYYAPPGCDPSGRSRGWRQWSPFHVPGVLSTPTTPLPYYRPFPTTPHHRHSGINWYVSAPVPVPHFDSPPIRHYHSHGPHS